MNKEEIEKAKRICRLLCGKKNKKGKREYKTFTRMQMQIDYTVDQMAEAIETLLQYIEQLEQENKKLNDIIENKVHYIKCKNCGIEMRVKRSDAKKKQRAEKSKISMQKIRLARKDK